MALTSKHLGSICGNAKRDWYDPSGQQKYARKGQGVCVYTVSNMMAQHLLKRALHGPRSLSGTFLKLVQDQVKAETEPDESRRDAALEAFDQLWDGSSLPGPSPNHTATFASFWAARAIFGKVVMEGYETAEKSNPLILIGKSAGLPALGLAILLQLDQIRNKGACIQFTVTTKGSGADKHAIINSTLLYNPRHFTEVSGSWAREFVKKKKRLRLDSYVPKHLGLSCNADGEIKVGPKRDNNALLQPGWTVALGRGPSH